MQTTGRLFVYLILGFEEEAKREFDLLTTNERKQFVQNIGLIDVALVAQNWDFPSHVFSRLNTDDRIALITNPGFKLRFIHDHASCARMPDQQGCNLETKPENILSNVVLRPYKDKIVEGGFRPLTIVELSEKERVLAGFLETVSMFAYNNNVLNMVPDGSLVLQYAETQTSINNTMTAITGIAAVYCLFSVIARILQCFEKPIDIERKER